jgi:hypothetical protein
MCLPAALVACAHKPPADFAPDPGLVARIRAIQMTTESWACPGQVIGASYVAMLDDGSRVPFATSYDADHPPMLHVSFLDRSSPQARANDGGSWTADPDPLLSTAGFALHASLRQNPSLSVDTVVAPEYSCLSHNLSFEGNEGGDGPDVTVRLASARSNFYPQLLIASVAVGRGAPHYLFADVTHIPPRGWLVVEAGGGRGGRGSSGRDGRNGTAGAVCTDGGAGGPGSGGGDGGPGGRGGHIVIISPAENPFLAGVVEARTRGGRGGAAGSGGSGGRGGAAGPSGTNCTAGHPGAAGAAGPNGNPGVDGRGGAPPQVITVPNAEVLGSNIPPELAKLLVPAGS